LGKDFGFLVVPLLLLPLLTVKLSKDRDGNGVFELTNFVFLYEFDNDDDDGLEDGRLDESRLDPAVEVELGVAVFGVEVGSSSPTLWSYLGVLVFGVDHASLLLVVLPSSSLFFFFFFFFLCFIVFLLSFDLDSFECLLLAAEDEDLFAVEERWLLDGDDDAVVFILQLMKKDSRVV